MFADNLKNLRKEKRLTQSKLAKIIGVSTGTIGGYEAGLREPDFLILQKLADYFDVSIDYLLGRENSNTIEKPKKNTVIFFRRDGEKEEFELSEEKAALAREILKMIESQNNKKD